MTDSTVPIRLREGFRDQILYVIPRPVLARSAAHSRLHSLMSTDIGWYPHARYHDRARIHGVPEHILLISACGQGWYDLGAGRQVLTRGQALLIPANTSHVYGASQETP